LGRPIDADEEPELLAGHGKRFLKATHKVSESVRFPKKCSGVVTRCSVARICEIQCAGNYDFYVGLDQPDLPEDLAARHARQSQIQQHGSDVLGVSSKNLYSLAAVTSGQHRNALFP
jgi:hypothetical protein